MRKTVPIGTSAVSRNRVVEGAVVMDVFAGENRGPRRATYRSGDLIKRANVSILGFVWPGSSEPVFYTRVSRRYETLAYESVNELSSACSNQVLQLRHRLYAAEHLVLIIGQHEEDVRLSRCRACKSKDRC